MIYNPEYNTSVSPERQRQFLIADNNSSEQRVGIFSNGKQTFFNDGEGTVHTLIPYAKIELANGSIKIQMYTIAGNSSIDIADIIVTGDGTPWQFFTSGRLFIDYPLEIVNGEVAFAKLSRDGQVNKGKWDPNKDKNAAMMFGDGEAFSWRIKLQPGGYFHFAEATAPIFIKAKNEIPSGEDPVYSGILEYKDENRDTIIEQLEERGFNRDVIDRFITACQECFANLH
jgi:hypothetical protein